MIECRLTGGYPDERDGVPFALSDEDPQVGNFSALNSREDGFSAPMRRFVVRRGNEVELRTVSVYRSDGSCTKKHTAQDPLLPGRDRNPSFYRSTSPSLRLSETIAPTPPTLAGLGRDERLPEGRVYFRVSDPAPTTLKIPARGPPGRRPRRSRTIFSNGPDRGGAPLRRIFPKRPCGPGCGEPPSTPR